MKRLISIILTLTLVIGLVPASFAAGENAATEFDGYEFKFIQAAHGTFNSDTPTESNQSIANIKEGYDAWGFIASCVPSGGAVQVQGTYTKIAPNKLNSNKDTPVTFSPDMTGTPAAYCFELEVTQGGAFVPTLNWVKHNYGPIVEVYLVPKNEAGTITDLSGFVKGLDSKFRMGTIDSNAAASATMNSLNLKDNTNYYLICVINGLQHFNKQLVNSITVFLFCFP